MDSRQVVQERQIGGTSACCGEVDAGSPIRTRAKTKNLEHVPIP
jgi:hypothetical protein